MHRACRRPEGIKAASDRLAIRFVITSGVAAPTGLSSVVPNAATRRNHSHHHRCRRRSCSLEIFHLALGLLASQYRFGTARSCSCCSKRHTAGLWLLSHASLNSQNETNSAASWAVKSDSRSFLFRVLEPCRSSSAFRCDREGPSTLEFRSSKNLCRARNCPRKGNSGYVRDDEGVKTHHDSTARSVQEAMIYHKPTTPRFRIAERICVQPPNNRPTYNKQNSHSSTCSLRSVSSTPPCISR